jgi:hypothetical protein
MKRIIAAVSFAVLSASAFAVEVSAPYDQSLVDRALPNIDFPAAAEQASGGATGDASRGIWATGVWANDPHFIAPAQ